MFLFELSRDPRSAHLFAAYVPVVGLPHGGYNDPPRGTYRIVEGSGNDTTGAKAGESD